jgi:hypothetical protein
MPFVFKKVLNYGTKHPVIARLKLETFDFLEWTELSKDKRERVIGAYFDLSERLLKCHEVYERLVTKRDTALAEVQPTTDPRVRGVPYLIGLKGELETFLYEGKNFLRELLVVVNTFFGTKFREASAFCVHSGKSEAKVVEWAAKQFGAHDNFTTMLASEHQWLDELISKRNAVEHPGGRSGTLHIENFKPASDGGLVTPTWRRDETPACDIFQDLETYLDNLLTFAEDVLVSCVYHNAARGIVELQFVEIAEEDRNPSCPRRIKIQARITLRSGAH